MEITNCPGCGKELSDIDVDCPDCNRRIKDITNIEQVKREGNTREDLLSRIAERTNLSASNMKKSRNNLWIIISIAVALIAAAVLIVSPIGLNLFDNKGVEPINNPVVDSSDPSIVRIITLDMYNKVEDGMSYDQVKKIIADSGELIAHSVRDGITTSTYKWYGVGNARANANFTFEDDKMILKAQYGLQ